MTAPNVQPHSPPASARFELKAATDDLHEELDGLLSRLNLARREDYGRFLQIHGRVVPSVESALSACGLGQVVDEWDSWRRSDALLADLAAMGLENVRAFPVPPYQSVPAMLGALYVLEGSRLGGQLLLKQVPAAFPSAYLSQSTNLHPWRSFIAVADRLIYGNGSSGEAATAARRCFTLFLDAAREAGI